MSHRSVGEGEMSRDEIKSELRRRILELRQSATDWRMKGYEKPARENDARALECERTLDLFGKSGKP